MAPSDRSAEATGPFDYAAAALAALLLTGLAATAVVRHGRARTA
jgi:hypothetical protein